MTAGERDVNQTTKSGSTTPRDQRSEVERLRHDLTLANALLRSVRGNLINSTHYEDKIMAEIDAYLQDQPR